MAETICLLQREDAKHLLQKIVEDCHVAISDAYPIDEYRQLTVHNVDEMLEGRHRQIFCRPLTISTQRFRMKPSNNVHMGLVWFIWNFDTPGNIQMTIVQRDRLFELSVGYISWFSNLGGEYSPPSDELKSYYKIIRRQLKKLEVKG